MSDDTTKRGQPDRIRISISQHHERHYWSGRFGISQKRLCDVVKITGPMVEDVKAYLIEQITKA